MLDLRINNISLFLPNDLEFTLSRENPLFNQRGDYSYPFTVPYDPNKVAFGNIREIEANDPNLPLTFDLFWFDELKLSGIVPSFYMRDGNIELTLISGRTSFNYLSKKKYINEIDMGSVVLTMEAINNSLYGHNGKYLFAPILAPNFYEKDSWERSRFPNEIVNKPDYDGFLLDDEPEQNILVAHIYLKFVVVKAVEAMGYKINRNDLDNFTDFEKAFVASLNVNRVSGVIIYAKQLPHITIAKFFEALGNWINLWPSVNDANKSVDLIFLREVIGDNTINSKFNSRVIDSPRVREVAPAKGYKLGYIMDTDDKLLTNDIDTSSPNIVADFANLPTAAVGYIHLLFYTTDTDRYYSCVESKGELAEDPPVYTWLPIGELRSFTEGEEEETDPIDIPIESYPVAQHPVTYKTEVVEVGGNTYPEGPGFIEIPTTVRQGNSALSLELYHSKLNEFPLTILFYRGLREYYDTVNSRVYKYPWSTYDNIPFIPYHTPISTQLTMKLHGTNGIVAKFHSVVKNWKAARKKGELYLDLTTAEAFEIDFLKKIQLDNMSFIVDKIHIIFGKNEVKSIRLELFTSPGTKA